MRRHPPAQLPCSGMRPALPLPTCCCPDCAIAPQLHRRCEGDDAAAVHAKQAAGAGGGAGAKRSLRPGTGWARLPQGLHTNRTA